MRTWNPAAASLPLVLLACLCAAGCAGGHPSTGSVVSRPAGESRPGDGAATHAELARRLAEAGVGSARDGRGLIVALDFDPDRAVDVDRILQEQVPRLESVEEVYLRLTDIRWGGISLLVERFPNVRLIDLRRPALFPEAVVELRALPGLRQLYLTPDSEEEAREYERAFGPRAILNAAGRPGVWRAWIEWPDR